MRHATLEQEEGQVNRRISSLPASFYERSACTWSERGPSVLWVLLLLYTTMLESTKAGYLILAILWQVGRCHM
jgi:hypothetical protein